MKYLDYKEQRQQGTFNFPIAFYHEVPHSPRYYMPYHWHRHYEIIRIISGAFHLTLNNDTRIYHEGDVIFITDGTLHGGNPQDHTCVYDCIVFDLQILLQDNHACSKNIHDIMDHKITIHNLLSERSPAVLPIVDNLTLALSGKKTGYEFMTQGYLYQLIGTILEEHLYEEDVKDIKAARHLNSIKNVLAYIAENYDSSISLDNLAKIAGMNPKYFCRYFRSMTERTPIDYLNYYRIECACEMLSTKDISIKETAISCGFNDESYFIKTFHKYKGITPKQFMKAEF
ncbi:MAG: AraC family transcriptional regulator [Lachnospiraceae bacterium]|nr:AraC family transcriptional regulator [Lachnospiraceae bacterium]MDE7021607.1 AraC family transcriptional regulator [Lachnospiraceae bacterium]